MPTGVTRDADEAPAAGTATPRSLAARAVASIRHASLPTRFLWVLLLLFVAKGIILTFVFPPFSGHDEVMHYAYLNHLAEEGRIPVIPELEAWRVQNDDPDVQQPSFDHAPADLYAYAQKGHEPKMSFTTADWWGAHHSVVWAITFGGASDLFPSGWIYTANHPPLYYLTMLPVFSMMDGATPENTLYALRLAAIPFGMITVVFAFLTARRLFPRDRFMSMVVPTLVAFQPQISYEATMLNNDILAIATVSACIYLIVAGLRDRFTVATCAWLGLALGLAMLAKTTASVIVPVIAVAMIAGIGWRRPLEWVTKGALVAGIAGVLAAPWYAFMLNTYGNLTALDRIEALQHWNRFNSGSPPTILGQLIDPWFAWNRWSETWGAFGWRLIILSENMLRTLAWTFFAMLIGAVIWAVMVAVHRRRLRDATLADRRDLVARVDPILSVARWQIVGVALMAFTCVTAYYAVLQFGTTFTLTQARYYFPAVNAGAIVAALGLRMLTPMRLLPIVQTAVFVGMFLLNVVILSAHVIPYWSTDLVS